MYISLLLLLLLLLLLFLTLMRVSVHISVSSSTDLTFDMWTPIALWTPEHSIQTIIPLLTTPHEGSREREREREYIMKCCCTHTFLSTVGTFLIWRIFLYSLQYILIKRIGTDVSKYRNESYKACNKVWNYRNETISILLLKSKSNLSENAPV